MSHLYADPNCPKCHGTGSIYVEVGENKNEEHRECLCVYRNMILAKLKKVHLDLPKYLPDFKKSPLDGRLEQNLVIYGPYETLLRHLNFALIRKYTREDVDYHCKTVTDLDLIHERFDNDSSSFLRSLKIPDLLVVFARNLFYENKAAPGYFLEAIMQRPHSGGTWIYFPKKLGTGFYCYSNELDQYLDSNFSIVSLYPPKGSTQNTTQNTTSKVEIHDDCGDLLNSNTSKLDKSIFGGCSDI